MLFLVLDPRLKLTYHNDHHWEEQYITEARNSVSDLYEKTYAPGIDQRIQATVTADDDDDLLSHIYKKRRASRTESELELYLGSPVVPGDVDVLQWWKVNNFIINFTIYNLQF
jgi:hypothetical protein